MSEPLPVSVIVPHMERRAAFFNRFVRPSIEQNHPAEILVESGPGWTAVKRNRGLDRATQEFVYYCDDDTIMGADCLARLISALSMDPGASFAYGNMIWVTVPVGALRASVNVLRFGPFRPENVRLKPCVPIHALWRRESCGRFDEQIGWLEDWDYCLTAVEQGKRGVWVDETLCHTYTIDEYAKAARLPDKAFLEVRAKHGIPPGGISGA